VLRSGSPPSAPTRPTFDQLRLWAEQVATTWARDAVGGDRLAIDDLPVAWALRIEAYNIILERACAALDIPTDVRAEGAVDVLKRRGFDRAIRAVGLEIGQTIQVIRRTRRRALRPKRPAMFLIESATPSMAETLRVVAAAHPSRAIVVTAHPGPLLWRGALEPGARLEALPVLRAARHALARVPRARSRWRDLCAAPPPLLFAGHDLSAFVLGALKPLVVNSVPWLVAEALAIDRLLDEWQPTVLVLASDQHRIGRVAASRARGRGIPSVVLQHGWPQHEIGYVPVAADLVAVWSEASAAWFEAKGTPRALLQVVGNPRLDAELHDAPRATAADIDARFEATARFRLLVALSPGDRRRNAELVDLALAAIQRLPDAVLVVKVHPGGGDWQDVRARVARAPSGGRVSVLRHAPLGPLLRWADLVVLDRSTVAFEALAFGTPVATYAGAPKAAMESWSSETARLRLPSIADADDVAALLTAMASPAEREGFFQERRLEIARAVGPTDGSVVDRVWELLDSLS
jgi:glycosyltransferase involved in cell wall biosynthesis